MPKVNNQIILWARENSRMAPDTACKRLAIMDGERESAVEKLAAYENSSKIPSRAMLKKMSSVYRLPMLAFYLEKPPIRPDRGEDFRTVPDDIKEDNAFLVDTLIRDVRSVQSTLKQVLIEQDIATPIDFVDSSSMEDGVDAVAQKIKLAIGFDLEAYRKQPDHQRAFKYLRMKAESAGIYVLLKGNLGSHHSDVEVEAFRGFALADDVVPFVVLNDKDAKSAWSFSILHELAHLVLGKTGISAGRSESKIEKFCNDVASIILIPDLEKIFFPNAGINEIMHEISVYSGKWNVSHSQLAYRIYQRGDYSFDTWKILSKNFRSSWLKQREKEKKKQRENNGGPSGFVLRRYRLGDALIKTVEGFVRSGAISTTKAGFLLGTKPLKVDKVLAGSFSMEGGY